MEARPGIVRRTFPMPGICFSCESPKLVTHYDRTLPGYICKACAPQAIYIDLLLVTAGLHHPNPHDTPNH